MAVSVPALGAAKAGGGCVIDSATELLGALETGGVCVSVVLNVYVSVPLTGALSVKLTVAEAKGPATVPPAKATGPLPSPMSRRKLTEAMAAKASAEPSTRVSGSVASNATVSITLPLNVAMMSIIKPADGALCR